MVFYKGHILAADQVGGFYSLRYDESTPAPPEAPQPTAPANRAAQSQQQPPTRLAAEGEQARAELRFVRNRLRGRRLRLELRGTGVRAA